MRKVLLLILLSCATNLVATTYYVSPTGNDSSPGSLSQPWRTITHAAQTVVAGDTVIAEDGTYLEALYLPHNGTASSPITFKSQNKWGAVIAPTSAQVSSNYGLVAQAVGTYVTLQGFDVVGPSDGSANWGIKAQKTATGMVVQGNKVHHIGNGTCNGGGPIESTAGNTLIDSNYVYDFGNLSGCNNWDGIYLTDGNGQTVTNNIVIGAGANTLSGLQMNGEIATTPNFPSNNVMTNNTIVNVNWDGIYMSCWQSGSICDNNIVSNNILYGINGSGGASVYQHNQNGSFGSHNQYSNNLIYNSTPTYMASGQALTNTVTSNPLVINYTGDQTGNYHLQFGSPAIDAGTSTGAPKYDFDGNSRPQGAGYDIGAYEYVGTNPNPNPPANLTAIVN